MTRLLKWAGVVVVVVLVFALVMNSCQSERRVQQAISASAAAEGLRSRAEAGLAVAVAELAANKAKVRILIKVDTLIRERIKTVLATPVPDTCNRYVQPLVDLVLDQNQQLEEWRGTWEVQSAATEKVLVVVDSLKASNDSLSKAVGLLMPQRRSLLGRLLHPEIKPAAFVGVCATGRPCVGAGVALTF